MSGPKAAGKVAGGAIAISASDRKLISTVKEVVTNHTDEEIYAMLKECNRDPNEAATRLMNEEKFHVVKHKKVRKKESGSTKEISDNQQDSTGSNGRSGRILGAFGTHGYGRGTSSFRSYANEGSGGLGKTVTAKAVKENDTSFPKAPSTTMSGNVSYSQLVQPKSSYANSLNHALLLPSSGAANGELSQACPTFSLEGAWPASAGFGAATNLQGAWLAGVGRGTIAEMLKGGGRKSNPPTSTLVNSGVVPSVVPSNNSVEQLSFMQVHGVMEPMASLSLDTHAGSFDNVVRQESGAVLGPGLQPDIVSYGLQDATSTQYLNNDGVSYAERGISSASVQLTDSNLFAPLEQTSISFSSGHSHLVEHADLEEGKVGQYSIPPAYEVQQKAESQQESAGPDWSREDPPNVGASGGTAVEAALASPSTTSGILAPGIGMEELHSVIIPDHIRVPEADCTMLNFGSFGAGFEGLASNPTSGAEPGNQIEDMNELVPLSPSVEPPTILDHDQEKSLASSQHLHSSANLSPPDNEAGIEEEAELEQLPAQLEYPSSYSVLNAVSVDSTAHYAVVSEADSVAHEANPVLVPYNNSMYVNNSVIHSSIPERHSSLSPRLASIGKLGTSRPAESIGQSASQEVINAIAAYPSSNPVGGHNGPAGMTVPQHSMHPYGNQPSGLPFGPFANTPSYLYMSPTFSYVQSPYQHNFLAGGGNYHQVPAAVGGAAGGLKYPLPQYKTSGPVAAGGMHNAVSPSSVGYGGYTNTQPASNLVATGANASSFEDAAPQHHYKDNMYLSSQQQLDGTSMWLQNQLAREAQGSSYYNMQGQSQQKRYSQSIHTHPGTVYGNAYHSPQAQLSPAQLLVQQQQALASMGSGLGTQIGSYQQNQRAQPSWPSSGF